MRGKVYSDPESRKRPSPRRAGVSRRSKVRRIRAAIRAGEYENALKLHVALERLLGKLMRERR